jgi:hypothetical protein
MYTDNFKAGVQYNDWTGSVAADDDDQKALSNYVDQHNLKHENEFLVGFKLYVGEHGEPTLTLLFLPIIGFDNAQQKLDESQETVDVRSVDIEISSKDFFDLFKRFQLCLSKRSIFEGRLYRTNVD